MDEQKVIHLLPYLGSLLTSMGVAGYCWQHRKVTGAKEYAFVAAARAGATLGFIFELLSATLQGKLFWDNLQWLFISYPILTLAFAHAFTSKGVKYRVWVYWLLALPAVIGGLLAFTDPLHGWVHPDAHLMPTQPFGELYYEYTLVAPVLVSIYVLIDLFAFGLLLRHYRRAHSIYRGQVATIIIGHLIPLIGSIVSLLELPLTLYRDVTPFTFALGNLIVVQGLLHYRLFEVVPIARDQVFDQMNDLIIVVDLENRLLDLNPAVERFAGKPASRLIGRPMEELFPAQADLVAQFRHVMEAVTEVKIAGEDGYHYFDVKISPMRNRKGEIIGRLIVSRDITALKRAQINLRKQQRRLRQLVKKRTTALDQSQERLRLFNEATFEGIILLEDDRILEANQQMADMMRVGLSSLINRNLTDLIAHEGQAQAFVHILASDESPIEFQVLKADGSSFVIEARSRPMRVDGRYLRVIAIRDISERKAAEESLRQSQERFRLILENMPILLDAFDENGNIVVWNKACEEVTGYGADEMIGNPRAMELLYPDPDYRAHLWEVAMDPTSTETTFDLTCKNGEVRTVMWFETYRTLTVPGWSTWGMGMDITERKHAETIIVQSAAELSRSNALITALAEVASQLVNTHDLTLIYETLGTELAKLGMRTVINLLDETTQQLSTQYTTIDPVAQEAFQREAGITTNQFAVPISTSETGITREMMDERRKQIGDDPRGYLCSTLLAGVPRQRAEQLLEMAGIHETTNVFWYPLIVKDQVVGTMVVWGQNLKGSDSLALSVFAGQVGSVIVNARLYQSEREQRELAEALRDSATALSSTLSLEEVVSRILDSLEGVMPHDAANVMLVDSGVARVVGKRGYQKMGLDQPKELARWVVDEIPGLQRMSQTGKPLAIPDTHQFPEWVNRPESEWVRSIVGAPISLDNEVIGFLNLDSGTPGFFSQKDAEHLQAFAAQAAVGIQNARLYEAERRERILAQTLQKTAAALIRSINTQDTLTLIMDQLAEIVPYDQALLMMVEESHLRLVASRGLPDDEASGEILYPYGVVPFLREILSAGQPVVLNDLPNHPGIESLPGIQPTTRSWMAVPLITWGIVTGLLTIGCNEQNRYSERMLPAASAFSQQAAVAMENVRMVSELSEMVFNLREAQARLTRSARLAAAGEIAAGVAHQINNPLTAIMGDVGLILRGLPKDDSLYESAEAIQEAATMAAKVVQRQLNLSRSVPYDLQPTDVNQSVSSAVALVKAQIGEVADLRVSLDPSLPLTTASPEHLSDVWLNMLLNARDALVDRKNPLIILKTSLSVDGNEIIITIQDNGQGISQEALGRVFDPFFTTKARGHGLGLPICYEVIRRHNGNIIVDSLEGVGTTMRIVIPVVKPAPDGID